MVLQVSLNKSVFLCLFGFRYDFLKFPSVKVSEIFRVYRYFLDTNFQQEKHRGCPVSFFVICKFVFFPTPQKLGLQIFLKNERYVKQSNYNLSG